MTDILSIINQTFPEQYTYLRLGTVKLDGKKVYVTFLVPEDVFDYQLTSEDIANIQEAVEKAVGRGFKPICHFEKIIMTPENIRSVLAEYMAKNFPLIAANVDFSRLIIDFNDGLKLTFTLQDNLYDYLKKSDFEKKIKEFFYNKFSVNLMLSYNVVPDDDITFTPETAPLDSGRYGKSVTVTDKVLMMGKLSDLNAPAVHISTVRGEGEDVVCCGRVGRLNFKTRDESKKGEYKRFFKHYYTFSINDTTGYLNIFINTDDQFGALQDGVEVVCKGRVTSRDDMSPSMYVKSIALCKIPFATIAEQTKPLDPPEHYSVLFPKEYHEVSYDQIGFDFLTNNDTKQNAGTANCVTLSVHSLKTERGVIPFEVAMCSVEKGKITEYMHTFLRVAFSEDSELAEYANRMGFSSPRLSTVIPDLLKFSAGRLVVGVNPSVALDLFNKIAKPLRYSFSNDVHVIQQSALKYEGEKKKGALDEAIAAANAYICE